MQSGLDYWLIQTNRPHSRMPSKLLAPVRTCVPDSKEWRGFSRVWSTTARRYGLDTPSDAPMGRVDGEATGSTCDYGEYEGTC